MSESPQPTDPASVPADDEATPVVIAVVRTGGIAGISRRWTIEAAPDQAGEWIDRIDRCPWDADLESGSGADRFVWSIRARTPRERRERDVPDTALSGPWRDLVDAVRAAAR
jgi:hypothetical protein